MPRTADKTGMDRRLDERYQLNMDVTVADMAAPGKTACGRIVNASQSGVCAHLSESFAPGAVVKVQLGDCSLFGHVTYCNEAEQTFRTGIEIIQVLIGESDLSRLVKAIVAEAMPAAWSRCGCQGFLSRFFEHPAIAPRLGAPIVEGCGKIEPEDNSADLDRKQQRMRNVNNGPTPKGPRTEESSQSRRLPSRVRPTTAFRPARQGEWRTWPDRLIRTRCRMHFAAAEMLPDFPPPRLAAGRRLGSRRRSTRWSRREFCRSGGGG